MDTNPAIRSRLAGLGVDANRIAPGLYQGAAPPPEGALRASGFDVVVFCAEEFQPEGRHYPGVRVIHCPLNDDGSPMTDDEWQRALACGAKVANLLDRGARVLVTCRAGRNRSGLVTAVALYFQTEREGAELVGHVRRARRAPSGPALTNPYFVRALAQLPNLGALGRAPT
jgi:hypothetical protein